MRNDSHASLRELSQQVANQFLREQDIIQHNVNQLKIILNPEKEADLRQSNLEPSQRRREDLYRHQMIKILKEKDQTHTIFIRFLAHQRELLSLKTRDENLGAEKEKKVSEEIFYRLDAQERKRLADLIQHIDKLIQDLKKVITFLEKLIDDLKRAMIEDNIRFQRNFANNIRNGLQRMGEPTENPSFILVGPSKVKVGVEDILEIFLNINEKAFHNIFLGKPEERSSLRDQALAGVHHYLQDKTEAENLQTAAAELMQVWDSQSKVLKKHILVQIERQDEITVRKAELETAKVELPHAETIKEQAMNPDVDLDFFKEFLPNAEVCVLANQTVIDTMSAKLDEMNKPADKLKELETGIITEQEALNAHKNKEKVVEQTQQNTRGMP